MKRKQLALALSCALITTLAVAGTWAYLSDTADKVTNTFTFCDEEDGIHLDLKETVFGDKYDEDGLNEDPLDLDKVVNMVPGELVAKNPTVKAEGAECYLFIDVIVENIKAESGIPFYTYSLDTGIPGYTWKLVAGSTDETDGGAKDGKASYVLTDINGPCAVADGTEYAILLDEKDDELGDYNGVSGDTTEVRGSVEINPALVAADFEVFADPEFTAVPSLSFVAYAVQSANIDADAVEALFLNEFKPVA